MGVAGARGREAGAQQPPPGTPAFPRHPGQQLRAGCPGPAAPGSSPRLLVLGTCKTPHFSKHSARHCYFADLVTPELGSENSGLPFAKRRQKPGPGRPVQEVRWREAAGAPRSSPGWPGAGGLAPQQGHGHLRAHQAHEVSRRAGLRPSGPAGAPSISFPGQHQGHGRPAVGRAMCPCCWMDAWNVSVSAVHGLAGNHGPQNERKRFVLDPLSLCPSLIQPSFA